MNKSQLSGETLGVSCTAFASKRRDVRCTYDFSASVGFTQRKRWGVPGKSDDFIEFSIKRFEFQLHLIGGTVDEKEGDKLGGTMKTRRIQSVTTTKTRGRSSVTSHSLKGNVSAKPSLGAAAESKEQLDDGDTVQVREKAEYFAISSDFSNPSLPSWRFLPIKGRYLKDSFSDEDLCSAHAVGENNFRYYITAKLWAHDIKLNKAPDGMLDKLRLQGLNRRGIEKKIANFIERQLNNRRDGAGENV